MMNNLFIFVLGIYILMTNPYIKLIAIKKGVFLIFTRKEYKIDEHGYKELDHVAIKKIL